MNGFLIKVYKITDTDPTQDKYGRENQEEIFEQKVETLNLKQLVAVVNGLIYEPRIPG